MSRWSALDIPRVLSRLALDADTVRRLGECGASLDLISTIFLTID